MEMELKLGPPQAKLVSLNGEQKLGDFCLVCFSKVDRSKVPKQSSLLSTNLNVIFLLRNLLQVPSDLLIGHFKKCGSPAYWISLCENCSQLTSQAMEHHLQILKLVNQLRSVLKIITDKMRESSAPTEILTSYQDDISDDKKKSMQEKRLHILKRTMEFVTNYDYNIHLVNPFIEGDKLARELDGNEESSSSDDEEGSAVEWDDDGGGGEWGGGWQEDDDDEDETQAPLVGEEQGRLNRYVKVDGKFKCQYCDTLLSSKRGVRTHEQKRHPEKAVRGRLGCKICGRMVNSKMHLNFHQQKVHKIDAAGNPIENKSKKYVEVDGKWKCRHCEKLFLTKGAVNVHMNEKHPKISGQFVCSICGKKWNSQAYLSNHYKKAHTVAIQTRKVHLEVDGKWKCRSCDQVFDTKKAVWIHEKHMHPEVAGQFKCEICGKSRHNLSYLRAHQRRTHQINAAGNPIMTKYGKGRKGKPNVKPKEPSTCHLCGKMFSWKCVLTSHLKHVHEKMFSIRCHVCGLGVYTNFDLNTHLLSKHKDDPKTLKLIEDGVKYFKCGVKGCRGTFRKESGLEEHMRKVHGGGGEENDSQVRFSCAFCGKPFRYWCKLKNHENLHKLGADKPYSCDVCGNKYRSVESVRKHKRRFHSEICT